MTTQQLFHEVVKAHGFTVLRVCASVLGPGPDAEDAWSETFVAALKAHPLADDVNVEAWLVTVARRKCFDVLRSRQHEFASDPAEPLFAANAGEHPPPDGFDDALWGAVAQLAERQQFVIAHRYIAQWTYPEIAEKLGCSPAAARRTGADAVAKLRAHFAAHPHNPQDDA